MANTTFSLRCKCSPELYSHVDRARASSLARAHDIEQHNCDGAARAIVPRRTSFAKVRRLVQLAVREFDDLMAPPRPCLRIFPLQKADKLFVELRAGIGWVGDTGW